MANDAARMTGNQRDKEQTPPAALVASMGEGINPPEPHESESKDKSLPVETNNIIDREKTQETGSSNEVQGEGKEDYKIGDTDDPSAEAHMGDAECVGGNQNALQNDAQQPGILIGESETTLSETTKSEGETDDGINTGKRGADGLTVDPGHTTDDAKGVIRKNLDLPKGVVEPNLQLGERETISTENVKDEVGNRMKIGKGEDSDKSADVNMSDAERVRGDQELIPEKVLQQQLLMGEMEKSRSSEIVQREGEENMTIEIGKGITTYPSADDTVSNNSKTVIQVSETEQAKAVLKGGRGIKKSESSKSQQQEDDKITPGKREDLSTQPNISDAESVNQDQKQDESVKQEEVQKGDLGIKSSESSETKKKQQDTTFEYGESEKGEQSVNMKNDEIRVTELPRESGTIKQRILRRGEQIFSEGIDSESDRKRRKASEGVDVAVVDQKIHVESVTEDISKVEDIDQERITKEGTSWGERSVSVEATESGVAKNPTSVDRRKRQRDLGAYLSGLGVPPPQPSYSQYYPLVYSTSYLPPYMAHPLPHHPLHHPYPYAALPYKHQLEHQIRAHEAAARMPLPPHVHHPEAERLRAVAESRYLGPPMRSVPIISHAAHQSYAPTRSPEAQALRVGPTIQEAAFGSRPYLREARGETLRATAESLRFGTSIRSIPAFNDAARGIRQPSQETEADGRKAAAALTLRSSSAAIGMPPAPVTTQALPPAVAAEAFSSRAAIPEEELPVIDPSSMDPETLERVRRDRKNAQSRIRSAKLRNQLDQIRAKPQELRTEEERLIVEEHERRRQRKNQRSRKRANERKQEMDRIKSIPCDARTGDDVRFMEMFMGQKNRKIEGDRLRRSRMKQLGFASTDKAQGITARGPLPPEYQQVLEREQSEEHP